VADGAGVGDGLRAAAFVLGAVHAILRPELERDADDLITLLQQQRSGSRGINSPAHADDDALTLLRIHRGTLYNFRVRCKLRCSCLLEILAMESAERSAKKPKTRNCCSFSPGEKVRMRAS